MRPDLLGLDAEIAYELGQADAADDWAAGNRLLAEIGADFNPTARLRSFVLRQQCEIEVVWLTGCVVSASEDRYRAGYNEVAEQRIREQHGDDYLASAYRRAVAGQTGGEAKELLEKLAQDEEWRVVEIGSDGWGKCPHCRTRARLDRLFRQKDRCACHGRIRLPASGVDSI